MGYSPYGKYIGNYSSLNPGNANSYGEISTGYEMSAGMLGATTNPGTANQVAEVMAKLNEGMKTIELTAEIGQGGAFEQVPQEQFKEINRLAKLSGMTPTMHAPKIDPAGFERGEQGTSWSENSRQEAERKLLDSIRRIRDANPTGNFNVTIHASNMPGLETKWVTEDGKQKEIPMLQYVVDVSSGNVGAVQRQELFKPQEGTEIKISTPEDRIKKINENNWNQSMVKLMESKRVIETHFPYALETNKEMDEEYQNNIKRIVAAKNQEASRELMEIQDKMKEGILSREEAEERSRMAVDQVFDERNRLAQNAQANLEKTKEMKMSHLRDASHYYDNMQNEVEVMYNDFQKDLVNRQEKLKRISDEKKRQEKADEIAEMKKILTDISKDWQKKVPELKKLGEEIKSSKNDPKKILEIEEKMVLRKRDLMNKSIEELEKMRRIAPQEIIVPLEEFARDKTVDTFSNIAMKAYKEWGDKAPIIAIENWEPNMAFSRADQLKNLIKETRESFIHKAEKGGLSREKAEAAAERMIGATWDVAHINLLRRQGATEKDVVKETGIIAPYVKKMHIVDNFGYTDAHLPIGWGMFP